MYYIGVDLGGTNIAVGIVNENYEIVKKGSTPTKPDRGADAIVADMAAVAKKLLSELGITMDQVASAGVATPGTANHDTGVVEYANNIPFLLLSLLLSLQLREQLSLLLPMLRRRILAFLPAIQAFLLPDFQAFLPIQQFYLPILQIS